MGTLVSCIFKLLKCAGTQWVNHNAMRLAAAMAFYTMMALAPMLVVALKVLNLIYRSDSTASGKIQDRATLLIGSSGAQAIGDMLKVAAHHGAGGAWATAISFIVALVSASSLFSSLHDAMDTIWDVKPRDDAGWRVMILSRLVSLVILLVAGAILMASLLASTVLGFIVSNLPGWQSWASITGELAISFLVETLIFAIIFKYMPDVIIAWSDVWLGAAITAALFLLGRYGLTLYFRFASVQPFGAAGSLAALLIWVYYSAMLVFFGAEFIRAYGEGIGKPVVPSKYAVRLATVVRAIPDEVREGQAKDPQWREDHPAYATS